MNAEPQVRRHIKTQNTLLRETVKTLGALIEDIEPDPGFRVAMGSSLRLIEIRLETRLKERLNVFRLQKSP